MLFLVYELAFCALTLALLRWHPNARALPWVRAVSRFVLLYYGLWAAADAMLLATGADLGYALRVIPNLLYYGGLVAAIAWLAPAALGDTGRVGHVLELAPRGLGHEVDARGRAETGERDQRNRDRLAPSARAAAE